MWHPGLQTRAGNRARAASIAAMGIGRRPQRRRIGRAAVSVALVACAAVPLLTAQPAEIFRLKPEATQSGAADATQKEGADAERQARAVCGSCHAYPPPDILPRDSWRDEFVRMMFIREGRTPPIGPPGIVNRSVQLPPDMEQVLPFYLSHAPERLPPPETWPQPARDAAVVHAPGDGRPRNDWHSGGVPRAPRRSGRRRSARRARHRHAPGARLQRQSRGAWRDARGDREHSPSGSRHARRRRQGRCAGSPRRRNGGVLPGRSRQGRRDLDAWPGEGQIRRVLARRLAARRQRRCRGLQRGRQDGSRRRRVRLAQDRAGRRARESHQQPVAAVVHHPHDRPARRQHPARSRRSEPRRQDGLRHAARTGARNGPRLHQHRRRRVSPSSARSSMPRRIRTGDRRDSSSSISTRTATSTSS